MPVIQKEESIAAGATANVFAGSAFEYARQNEIVSIGLAGSATGLVATIQSGAEVVLEESPILVKTSMPTIPDDMYYNDVAVQGDRIKVNVRNTTAGALTVRAVAQITPV